jgi:predicted RNase H-like HicB family nuclease
MRQKLKMRKAQFTAIFRKCEGWYAATVLEVSGVHTQGRTLREARANLRDALELVLETRREMTAAEAGADEVRETIAVEVPA